MTAKKDGVWQYVRRAVVTGIAVGVVVATAAMLADMIGA